MKEEWEILKEKERILKKACSILRVREEDLPKVVERFLKEIEEIEEKIKSFRA